MGGWCGIAGLTGAITGCCDCGADDLQNRLAVARRSEQGWLRTTKVMENIVDALQARLLASTDALRTMEDKVS